MHLTLFVDWTAMTRLMKFRKTKKQKVATGLLPNKLNKQDFVLSLPVPRVLGPISRHRVAGILPHMRASRPGLLVGFLRIRCNGLSTAQ